MDNEKEIACRAFNDFIDMMPRFEYFKNNVEEQKILITSLEDLKNKLKLVPIPKKE